MPALPPHSFYPVNRAAWRQWLQTHHAESEGVWVIYYKVAAQQPTISWTEAVEEALCFGWIDSRKKTIDQDRYTQFFCPRKPNSTWSKINKDKVEWLQAQGLMTVAGLEAIRIAQENGSWSILDEVEALIVPADLQAALQKIPGAVPFFTNLSKSKKKSLLYWVASAKRPATRHQRIVSVATCAGAGTLPHAFQ